MDQKATTLFISLLRKALDESITAPEAQSFLSAANRLLTKEGTCVEAIRFRSVALTLMKVEPLSTLQDTNKQQKAEIERLRAELSEARRTLSHVEQENDRLAQSRLRGHVSKWLPFWSHVTARLGGTHGTLRIFVDRFNAYAEHRELSVITPGSVAGWQKHDEVPLDAITFARSPWLTRPTAEEKDITEQDWTFDEDKEAERLAAAGKTSNQAATILSKQFGRRITVGSAKKALQRCRIRDAVLDAWDKGERDIGTIVNIARRSPDAAAYDITSRKVRRIIANLRDQPHLLPRQAVAQAD